MQNQSAEFVIHQHIADIFGVGEGTSAAAN